MRPVVIGVGNRWRGDDGVGPAVIDLLRADGRLDTTVADLAELDGEATRLVDAMAHRSLAVVVDAMRSGAAPGTVRSLVAGEVDLPTTTSLSSHGAGVAHAAGLAAALDRMPDRLVVIGVEISATADEGPLSAEVTAALPEAAARVVEEVRRHVSR
ncbi:MAG: hydrogenase maturation protease [Acidimicrobiales bacterium]